MNETTTTEIYAYGATLALRDALPIFAGKGNDRPGRISNGRPARQIASLCGMEPRGHASRRGDRLRLARQRCAWPFRHGRRREELFLGTLWGGVAVQLA